jgi:molybdate transport system ATP-binding protein
VKFILDLALKRPDFALRAKVESEGKRIGLFGPSGAGKTTLVRSIAGLEAATGQLQVDDDIWLDTEHDTRVLPFARRVGWVPQGGALLPHRTVRGNLTLGAHSDGVHLEEVAAVLGLEALLDRKPHQLSGGEAKRVTLGRALLSQPRLLLLDEPLAGLDWPRRNELLTYLLRVLERFDVPALYVSHNPFEVGVFCEKVWLLELGKIVGTGSPEQVFLRPESASQALLAGVENIWRGRVKAAEADRVTVALGANRLNAEYTGGKIGDEVVVVLAAAEVLLSRTLLTQTSARNVWTARVTDLSVRGREVAVHLGCGPAGISEGAPSDPTPMVALITPAALADLELKQGDTIYAVFKAIAVRVFPT